MRTISLILVLIGAITIPLAAGDIPTVTLTPQWALAQFAGDDLLERALITLTNAKRRAARLPELTLDTSLQTAARQHSLEMGERQYFAHESPEAVWRMPWQRTYMAGYWGQEVGENVGRIGAIGRITADEIANGLFREWMQSTTHARNILDPSWSRVGLGVVKTGDTYYASQLFGAPMVLLDSATITPTTGQLATLTIDGALPSGQVTLWVNGFLRQTLTPAAGKFTGTLAVLQQTGAYNIAIGLGNTAVWTAQFDSGTGKISGLRVLKSGIVRGTTAGTAPVTGVQLRAALRVSPGTKEVTLLLNGLGERTVKPDTQGTFVIEQMLPAANMPYAVGILMGKSVEDLLFIDATQPPAKAFLGRPERSPRAPVIGG